MSTTALVVSQFVQCKVCVCVYMYVSIRACQQVVMKELLTKGYLHGDCLTVTGLTVADNLKNVPSLSDLPQQVCVCVMCV